MKKLNNPLDVSELEGFYVAIITPMKHDGVIDTPKLEQMIEDFINADVSGICLCGTTGQSPTLSNNEHIGLVKYIVKYVNKRTKIIVATGSNKTRESIHLLNEIEHKIGPTTFLHVTGYYNNPPQEGLILHFKELANSFVHNESNLIIYNVPIRTCSNIEAETVIKLSTHPGIIGIKDVPLNIGHVEEIIKETDKDKFKVLSGDDFIIAKVMELGGVGAISAAGNIAPRYLGQMVNAGLRRDYKTAKEMQRYIMPLIQAVYCDRSPIPLAHIFNTYLRLPLCRLPRIQSQIDEALVKFSPSELGIDVRKYNPL